MSGRLFTKFSDAPDTERVVTSINAEMDEIRRMFQLLHSLADR
jgi:hypothetical protein